MAQSKNKVVTHGLSGKVGGILVFSQRGGRTIVSRTPRAHTGEVSEKQKEHKAKFQEAVLYAKNAINDPETQALYKAAADPQKGISAYNVAVADLFNAPKIEEINLSNYSGKVGDKISVKVTDDFKVVSVKVIIENADGSLVEEGDANQKGIEWTYITKVINSDLSGDKITIQATDMPDNLTEKTKTL